VTRAEARALSERQWQILRVLCREYIVSGRPVASSSVSRALGLRWSSATIRNELVALEGAGFVFQPHQSAGRIPTGKGLDRYIRDLPIAGAPPAALRRVVDSSLASRVSGAADMRPTARVLSEIVGCVAVAFIGEPRRAQMRQVELILMQGACALITLTLGDGTISRHPIRLDSRLLESADEAAIGRLQERLRELCVGKTLSEARALLERMVREEEARFDRWLGESLRVGLLLCTMANLEPLWLQVAGQRMLATATAAAAGGVDALAHILGLLEDYHQLAEVLCQLLPAPTGDDLRAEVRIGDDLGALLGGDAGGPALSLVGCRLPSDGGGEKTGAIALLGPDRMDYEAVIPLVEYAAHALASRTCA
jgi:heat-inducible transcriptional repressor